MQEGFSNTLGKTISTADMAPQSGGAPPTSPPERFANAATQVDLALDELSRIVSVLTSQDEAKEQPQVAGQSTPSVVQIVRNYPDELELVAKRIHRDVERLRDAFFTP